VSRTAPLKIAIPVQGLVPGAAATVQQRQLVDTVAIPGDAAGPQ